MWSTRSPGDHACRVAEQFAKNLQLAAEGRALIDIAHESGVDAATIKGILAGRVLPDLRMIAMRERAFGRRLWPDVGADDSWMNENRSENASDSGGC